MQFEHFEYAKDGDVAHVTLDRPERLNAFLVQTWREFTDALERAEQEARVVVLSGNGRAFSSGDDISDLEFEEKTPADVLEYSTFITESIFTVERVSVPVIAAVDGIAYGGGCELAAICDVTIASDDSEFRQPEPLLGNVPGIAISRFVELLGLKRARELLLTTRALDAAEAHRIGLVNQVVPAAEFEAVVEKRAQEVIDTAPLASELMKRSLNDRLSRGVDGLTMNAFLFQTSDMAEGVEAFFDDRDPEWTGR